MIAVDPSINAHRRYGFTIFIIVLSPYSSHPSQLFPIKRDRSSNVPP